MKFNEETETLQFNRELFEEGPKSIVDKFEHELVEFPNKFTIKVLSDPTNEDYGFNIDNPIEVTGVAVEYQYLKGITYHGEDITFKHSFDYKGKYDNWVDSFDIFVDGEKITTLYFTSDGSYNSISCPKGFEFKESITENTNTTKNKDNEDDEYNNYALYLSENSNGIIDLNEAYNFIEVLNIYMEKGKNAALKEFDMLCKQIIKDSGPILSISKTSFLLGVLNSNQIIDEHEMNEQGEKYQEICLNLIMKDKK